MDLIFKDRKEAGKLLSEKLINYKSDSGAIVLGIPRGGVEVAYEVAQKLNLPLDILEVKKIGYPGNPEFAIGAAGIDSFHLNEESVKSYNISEDYIKREVERKQAEIKEAYKLLRGEKPLADLKDKTVILIDDGAATGATMVMAAKIAKGQAKKVVVALPVSAPDAVEKIKRASDEVICLMAPPDLAAVGEFYENFNQVENEQVKEYLKMERGMIEKVVIPVGIGTVEGDLVVPPYAREIVVFAYGSGSSRFSPREQFVAKEMQKAGLGTLLMDLLTKEEEAIDEETREYRFNIELLAERMIKAIEWLRKYPASADKYFGYFGASTGAAAILIAAAKHYDEKLKALVSRGGRPDLAIPYLDKVKSPVLMIVGGDDLEVIKMNEEAIKHLINAETKLEIIPGATHLFEEPGALEKVAELSIDWFKKHL